MLAPQVFSDVQLADRTSPITHGLAQAGAMLAGVGITGGISALGEGAEALTARALAGGAAEATEAAEVVADAFGKEAVAAGTQAARAAVAGNDVAAVAPTLEETLFNKGISRLTQAAPRAANAAVQGAAYNFALSEQDLDASPMQLGEQVLAQAGVGFLLGGVGGEVTHGLMEAVVPAGKRAAGLLGEGLDSLSSRLSAGKGGAELNASVRKTTAGLAAVEDAVGKLQPKIYDEQLPALAEKSLGGRAAAQPLKAAVQDLMETGADIVGQKGSADTEASGLHAAEQKGLGQETQRAFDKFKASVAPVGKDVGVEALQAGLLEGEDGALDGYNATDTLRKDLRQIAKRYGKDPSRDVIARDALQGLRDKVDAVLANPDAVGDVMSSANAKARETYASLRASRAQIQRQLGERFETPMGKGWRPKSQKVATAIGKGDSAANDELLGDLQQYKSAVGASHDFSQNLDRQLSNVVDAAGGLGSTRRIQEAMDTVQAGVTSADAAKAGAEAGGLGTGLAALGVLAHFHPVVGGIALGAKAVVAAGEYLAQHHPEWTAGKLTLLARGAAKVQQNIEANAASLIRGGEYVAMAGSAPVVAALTNASYQQLKAQVGQLAASPEAFHSRVTEQGQELNAYAPSTFGNLVMAASSQLQLLQAALQGPELVGYAAAKYQPSATELSRMSKQVATITNPATTVKAAQQGTLTPQQWQLYSKAFPQHAKAFTVAIGHELAQSKRQDQLGLKVMTSLASMGLGVPAPRYSQPMLQRTQAGYALRNSQAGGPGSRGATHTSGSMKLNIADATLLPGQRISQRPVK